MDHKEIVEKLIGPIDPVGETNADNERFENLKVMTDLVESLLLEINDVAFSNRTRHEHSMKQAGQHADRFLALMSGEYKPDLVDAEENDDILDSIKAIRKEDCGGWLKDCHAIGFSCGQGISARMRLAMLLNNLYKAAKI